MYGKSLWEVVAMRSLPRGGAIVYLAAMLCGVLWDSNASAQVVKATLSDIFNQSDVIFLGHRHESDSSPDIVSFDVVELFKGKKTIGRSVHLCNYHPDSEWPELIRLEGEKIIFASWNGSCLRLAMGYRSVVPVSDGVADTSGITGLPLRQPLSSLKAALHALIAHR